MMIPVTVLYHPGTFGNCVRWLLDRFSPDSRLKHMSSPWNVDGTAHGPFNSGQLAHAKINRSHQFATQGVDLNNKNFEKIVINFRLDDFLFAERCWFHRAPNKKNTQKYEKIIDLADSKFLKEHFNGLGNESVAKEIYKIKFHDHHNQKWWSEIIRYMNDLELFQFPVYALFDKSDLRETLMKASERFNMDLEVVDSVLDTVVDKISKMHTVTTIERARETLGAIERGINIECGDLDILEQAWLEVVLEKKHQDIIFPYGRQWFSNTSQIIDYIKTCPKYLRDKKPSLPWHNEIKRPYYLTGNLDES